MTKPRKHRKRTKKGKKQAQRGQPRLGLRSATGLMGLETSWKLIGPIAFLISFYAVVKLLVDTPVGEKFVAGTACLAVIYDIFDVVNWKRAALLREEGLGPLLATYVLWFFAMVAIAVVGFIVTAGSWEGFLVVFAFVFVAFRRARIEEDICKQFKRLGVTTPEPRWGKRFASWVDVRIGNHADRKIDDDARPVEVVQRSIARWLRTRPVSPHHDGRRVVALMVIVAAVLFGAWTGIVWALAAGKRAVHEVKVVIGMIEPGHSNQHDQQPTPAAVRTVTVRTATVAPSAGNTAPSVIEHSTESVQQSECATPPGTGAPPEMAKEIMLLYEGPPQQRTGHAPGSAVAGCTGPVHRLGPNRDLFIWTEGTSPQSHAVLSLAIDSNGEFGGASLFLSPAVEPVLSLIKRFGAIGGIRRFDIGTGDFYPVQTPLGTYLLIRREKGTEQAAKQYRVLPPAVAQAWTTAIRNSGMFLWPVQRRSGGGLVYDFETNTMPSHVAYTFPYHHTDRSEPELSETELEMTASQAD